MQSALDIISNASLSPTEHLLLKHFVEGAVHPDKAADYLLSRVQASNGQVEHSLRQFKQEWRHLVLLGTTPEDASLSRLTNTLVTTFDPIPRHVQDLAIQRDGRDYTMRRIPSHAPGSKIEPAYVIPPPMLRGLDSGDQVNYIGHAG
jgi:hypothetical protein